MLAALWLTRCRALPPQINTANTMSDTSDDTTDLIPVTDDSNKRSAPMAGEVEP
jgi:uncharacterized hydantoinase/oxoprolinase family protein